MSILLTVEQTLAVAEFAAAKLAETPEEPRANVLASALTASGIVIGEASPLPATQQVVREGDLFRIQALPIYATNTREMYGLDHDDLWMFDAAARAAVAQNEGHLPPAHSEHHTYTGADRPRLGFLSRQTVGLGYQIDGVVRAVLFSDVLVESEDAMREIMARPYRSTETPIEDSQYVASLAFMESDAPHIKFPLPVYVGDIPDGATGEVKASTARYVTINASARAFAWFPQRSKKMKMKTKTVKAQEPTIPAMEDMPEEPAEEQVDKLDQVLSLLQKLAEKLLADQPDEESVVEAPVADASELIAAKVEILKAQSETKKALSEIASFNRVRTIDAFVTKLKDENRAFDEAAVRAQCSDFVGNPKLWESYKATIEAAFPRAPGAGTPEIPTVAVDGSHPVLGVFASDPERYQKAHGHLNSEKVQAAIKSYPGNKESFARELVAQLIA